MNTARLRVDQQIIAGLLKDRARLVDEIAKANTLMQWGQATYATCSKEITRIDLMLADIQRNHAATGSTPKRSSN